MEHDFYKWRLTRNHGLDVLVPAERDRELVHRIIYQELCLDSILPDSKAEFLRFIDALARHGAEAVILGCTEIDLLMNQVETDVRLFDTTLIHAQMTVAYALGAE